MSRVVASKRSTATGAWGLPRARWRCGTRLDVGCMVMTDAGDDDL